MPELLNTFRSWSYYRQYLGKRGRNTQQVLRDIIGVYSWHPSAALSFYARIPSFREEDFSIIDEQRLAFRMPAMRLSVHMLPAETAHLVFAATVPPAGSYWQKRYSQKGRAIPAEHYEHWKEQILRLAYVPLTAAEIEKATGIPDAMIKLVLNRMAFEGDVLRVGAKSLRSNIISYVATTAWTDNAFVQPEDHKALAWLAGEYLRAFGPVRVKDFQWWTGVTAEKAKTAMAAHETTTIGNNYLLLKSDLKEFETFKSTLKDTIDLLPQWDSYTMGYAPDGRARFVSPDMQQHIYGKLGATGGNGLGTVLISGIAHGSWDLRFKGNQMHIGLNMFEKPSGKLNTAITEQFNELATFFKAKSILIENK